MARRIISRKTHVSSRTPEQIRVGNNREKGYRTAERKVKAGRIDLNVIPNGFYCYGGSRAEPNSYKVCPFWSINRSRDKQDNGYCHLMEIGDWQMGMGLLWDQVKECPYNSRFEDDEGPDSFGHIVMGPPEEDVNAV